MQGINLKPFVGSQDYETSRDFYVAIGFTLNWDSDDLAELQLGGCRFFLQKYYQEDWCNNSMLHMTVDDARAWHEHIRNILEKQTFGAARLAEPRMEEYGSLVTYVWDPSGVLWHLAES